jgi:hypothetical protein
MTDRILTPQAIAIGGAVAVVGGGGLLLWAMSRRNGHDNGYSYNEYIPSSELRDMSTEQLTHLLDYIETQFNNIVYMDGYDIWFSADRAEQAQVTTRQSGPGDVVAAWEGLTGLNYWNTMSGLSLKMSSVFATGGPSAYATNAQKRNKRRNSNWKFWKKGASKNLYSHPKSISGPAGQQRYDPGYEPTRVLGGSISGPAPAHRYDPSYEPTAVPTSISGPAGSERYDPGYEPSRVLAKTGWPAGPYDPVHYDPNPIYGDEDHDTSDWSVGNHDDQSDLVL